VLAYCNCNVRLSRQRHSCHCLLYAVTVLCIDVFKHCMVVCAFISVFFWHIEQKFVWLSLHPLKLQDELIVVLNLPTFYRKPPWFMRTVPSQISAILNFFCDFCCFVSICCCGIFRSKMLNFTVQLIWKFWGHFYLCICVEWLFLRDF